MPSFRVTRTVRHSPQQMYDLVADVERYPEFLPWVSAMRVRKDDEAETLADMIVGFKGLRETFTSKVTKQRPEAIRVEYIEGPLKYLNNDWRFRPDGSEGFAKAEVTAGGIDTAGLSSQTMAVKSVPGLYAIGEAVDVTGWLGGYNFQWAWASGWAAGQAV